MAVALEENKRTRPSGAAREDRAPPLSMHRFTVDEYHQMIESGILKDHDRVQLLEGWIVSKMAHNPPHDTAVDLAQTAISLVLPGGWRLRVQSAITTRDSELEPDIAVVRGPARRHAEAHPGPRDIGMLVEVADASLLDDRTLQARIFARARIPVYWIINLVAGRLKSTPSPRAERSLATAHGKTIFQAIQYR